MADPTSCPRCHRNVLLPETSDPDTWVRCPLCRAAYQLQEAMNYGPPVLEVIEGPGDDVFLTVGSGLLEEGGEATKANVGTPATMAGTQGFKPSHDIELDEAARWSDAGSEENDFNLAETSAARPGLEDEDTQPVMELGVATGAEFVYTPKEEAGDEFALQAPEGDRSGAVEANYISQSGSSIASGRPRRKQKNALVEVAKIALGGIAGLTIGYMGLLWYLKRDPIPPLATYVPAMLLPESMRTTRTASADEAAQTVSPAPQGTAGASAVNDPLPPSAFEASQQGDDSFAVSPDNLSKGSEADQIDNQSPTARHSQADVENDSASPDPFSSAADMPADSGSPFDPAGAPDDPLGKADPLEIDPLGTVDLVPDALDLTPDPSNADAPEETAATDEADAQGTTTDADMPLDLPNELNLDAALPDPAAPDTDMPVEPSNAEPGDADVAPAELNVNLPDHAATEKPITVSVRGAPTYRFDQIDTAQQAAADAQASLAAAKQAGGPDTTKARLNLYRSLSQLAEALTFSATDTPDDLSPRMEMATALVRDITSDPKEFEQIGNLAGLWMGASTRKENGVVLAGNVTSVRPLGSVHVAAMQLPGGKEVTVVSNDKPTEGQRAVVLGSIVSNPTEAFEAVPADELAQLITSDTVVWVGHWIAMDAEAAARGTTELPATEEESAAPAGNATEFTP